MKDIGKKRKKIIEQYGTDENEEFCIHPGKFQGEPIFVPYFHDMMMDGMQDDTGDLLIDGKTCGIPIDIFYVTDRDRAEFPDLLDDTDEIHIWTGEQGFVEHQRILKPEIT